ncbi:MAG: glycosyltransferase [Butyrivibrio sp.]|uniref:glycosyltransferase n=1 Tax=Butyrivibrio sp. TaxID=28121 RepID=UPI001B6E4948|nr:glycosyltransferase [Butyrivibrio sp.]MBP3784206.1 glycosyltransferase [Butyrivibrio sp.]
MSIYIFSLLVGYVISGVDHAIGMSYSIIKQLNTQAKYVFTEIPTNKALKRYTDMGINFEDMICAQFSMAGNASVGGAQIQIRDHYSDGKVTVSEAITDRPLYFDVYSQYEKDGHLNQYLSRRTFLKPDGSVAYDIVYDKNSNEKYIFPDGEVCTKGEFLLKFMQSLSFSENDLIIIHRPGYMNFMEPLFLSKNNAHILVFLHSGHDFLPGEDPYYSSLNPEYYYFFENFDKIDTILVSTQQQKNEVLKTIEKYHFHKTNVEAIPIFGVKKRKEISERRPFSFLTVSRLDPRKHIDLLVRAAIEAHKMVPELTLDIYGTGNREYIQEISKLIKSAQAFSYITLKGYCDVSDVYDNYEAYITASSWETFGITLLDAINAGNAMVGFRARYGNTLFIKPGENGYLIDADFSQLQDEEYQDYLVSELSDKMQLVLSDKTRLESFHKTSYTLAKDYLIEGIEKKWTDYLKKYI